MNTILHILERSIPYISGYTIRSRAIIETLKKQGWHSVVVTSPRHKDFEQIAEEINGVLYIRCPSSIQKITTPTLLYKVFEFVFSSHALEKAIIKVCNEHKPRVIHAHSFYPLKASAYHAARKFGIPYIYELRGLLEESGVTRGWSEKGWRYRLIQHFDNYNLIRADAIVTISQTLKTEVMQRGVPESKIVVVPNGVDTQDFKPIEPDYELAAQLGLLDNILVIGYIGSLVRWEGLENLLYAFSSILRTTKNVKLLIVGDGPLRSDLLKLCDQLGINSFTIFTGQIAHENIKRYYSICDVLVLPRTKARVNALVTPLKPLEIMAMGKPLIASDLPALREIVISRQTGVLVEPDDPNKLAEAILYLLDDPQERKRLGANARAWVVENRDWSNIVSIYHEVYKKFL